MRERMPLVLVLEDEPLIGFEVEQRLNYFGFRVGGPFRSGLEAMGWIRHNDPDSVVFGVSLADAVWSGLAGMLLARNIPFVVHTTTTRQQGDHDPVFDKCRWVSKLSQPLDLIDAVTASLPLPLSGSRSERGSKRSAVSSDYPQPRTGIDPL
ncbi:hypothetical protein PZ897_14390 [Hoeflea sp. YIM 152468]|uniref:hypothetical protein n=1 Tax=Hoeflea sp. YIM 152468 TaxID=3031759 RepID=UPI0023DA508A|nr:hypothetical protein [Hoeflea sp. YIM 152468]MDF1609370.1 hypothetical protein [Hoeflea sp. YIM 152468]